MAFQMPAGGYTMKDKHEEILITATVAALTLISELYGQNLITANIRNLLKA